MFILESAHDLISFIVPLFRNHNAPVFGRVEVCHGLVVVFLELLAHFLGQFFFFSAGEQIRKFDKFDQITLVVAKRQFVGVDDSVAHVFQIVVTSAEFLTQDVVLLRLGRSSITSVHGRGIPHVLWLCLIILAAQAFELLCFQLLGSRCLRRLCLVKLGSLRIF